MIIPSSSAGTVIVSANRFNNPRAVLSSFVIWFTAFLDRFRKGMITDSFHGQKVYSEFLNCFLEYLGNPFVSCHQAVRQSGQVLNQLINAALFLRNRQIVCLRSGSPVRKLRSG